MYQIPRSEYDSDWELEKSGDQQNTQDVSGTKWGRMGQPIDEVTMNRMQNINTPRIEVTEVEARSEITDREAMKAEILGKPVLDATFSGDPVGGNEESISTLEADRGADMEAAEAREEELSGQFQEFEAQSDSDSADDADDAEDEDTSKADKDAAKATAKAERDAAKAERKASKA